MDLYSSLLLASMIAAGLSLVAALLVRLPEGKIIGFRLAVLGLILISATTLYHLAAGHAPGTPEGMHFSLFIQEHPALPIVGLLTLIEIMLFRPASSWQFSFRK